MLSANCFNLDQSKILSFGHGLTYFGSKDDKASHLVEFHTATQYFKKVNNNYRCNYVL